MKVRFTPKQAHTGDQAYQAKIMITVQMRNKNMVDTASLDTVFCNLHLGSFAAVDKKKVLVKCHYLRSRMPVKGWYRGIIAKDSDC